MSESASSSDDEYEVERIVEHRGQPPHTQYLIKWEGYPDEDNTWQNEEDVLAPAILQEYWERVKAGKEANKANRKNHHNDTKEETKNSKKRKTTSATSDKKTQKKTEESKESDDPDFNIDVNWPSDPNCDWYAEIIDVETVEKDSTDLLWVFLNLKNGARARKICTEANKKIPQLMIAFYEAHLRFKSPDEVSPKK